MENNGTQNQQAAQNQQAQNQATNQAQNQAQNQQAQQGNAGTAVKGEFIYESNRNCEKNRRPWSCGYTERDSQGASHP